MKCFYHNDLDGFCAGAIVYKFYKIDRDFTKQVGEDCQFICINYNQDFPFDTIKSNETIILVDYSLQKEGEFDKLFSITNKIIWIDHHKSAIEKHKDFTNKHGILGMREDGISGCVLTWKYFYPNQNIPSIVDMIGAYDIWDFSIWGEKLNVLQSGIRLYDYTVNSNNWTSWFSSIANIKSILDKGEIALLYRTNMYQGLIQSWSFWAEFEGYKAICCNVGSTSSQLFDSIKEDYDIMIPFVFDGKQWTVSLYTKKDIDCSEIAKKYGGGGHKKAAGFQCKELPFTKLEA